MCTSSTPASEEFRQRLNSGMKLKLGFIKETIIYVFIISYFVGFHGSARTGWPRRICALTSTTAFEGRSDNPDTGNV
jgi:hypothetical protein